MPNIGVTGHRFLAEPDRVAAGVDAALDAIEAAFSRLPLTVLSALAEGADRLVAERVLARPGGRLAAILPLPIADYASDFPDPASNRAFRDLLGRAADVVELPGQESRDAAYAACGHYVLDHCDVLLAVWDGRDAQGQGGTGEIVAVARRRGMPLAWVKAGNRLPGTTTPTSLGAEQGATVLERF